jgi:hypothetical protein
MFRLIYFRLYLAFLLNVFYVLYFNLFILSLNIFLSDALSSVYGPIGVEHMCRTRSEPMCHPIGNDTST